MSERKEREGGIDRGTKRGEREKREREIGREGGERGAREKK